MYHCRGTERSEMKREGLEVGIQITAALLTVKHSKREQDVQVIAPPRFLLVFGQAKRENNPNVSVVSSCNSMETSLNTQCIQQETHLECSDDHLRVSAFSEHSLHQVKERKGCGEGKNCMCEIFSAQSGTGLHYFHSRLLKFQSLDTRT